MKTTNKIKFFAVTALFITIFSINAQENKITSAGNQGCLLYQAEKVNGCYNIKFSLNNDCYAVLYAIDEKTGEKSMLVEGDISEGLHGVMFKTKQSGSYNCVLEAYDNNGNLLNTSNISLKLN